MLASGGDRLWLSINEFTARTNAIWSHQRQAEHFHPPGMYRTTCPGLDCRGARTWMEIRQARRTGAQSARERVELIAGYWQADERRRKYRGDWILLTATRGVFDGRLSALCRREDDVRLRQAVYRTVRQDRGISGFDPYRQCKTASSSGKPKRGTERSSVYDRAGNPVDRWRTNLAGLGPRPAWPAILPREGCFLDRFAQ